MASVTHAYVCTVFVFLLLQQSAQHFELDISSGNPSAVDQHEACSWPIMFSVMVRRTLVPGELHIKLPVFYWSKHGLTCVHAPDHDPQLDITISMDISLNPGPTAMISTRQRDPSFSNETCLHNCCDLSGTQLGNTRITYTRNDLLWLRYFSWYRIDNNNLQLLKACGILRYRGKRAGQRRHKVSVMVGNRPTILHLQRPVFNSQTLIRVPLELTPRNHIGCPLKLLQRRNPLNFLNGLWVTVLTNYDLLWCTGHPIQTITVPQFLHFSENSQNTWSQSYWPVHPSLSQETLTSTLITLTTTTQFAFVSFLNQWT